MKKKPIVPPSRSKSPTSALEQEPRQAGKAAPSKRPAHDSWFSAAALRELVESLVAALVLAFLIRTFEAEAFVIPTGSMAPTLMGRHKDVVCPKCGYCFQVSASGEVNPHTNQANNTEVYAGTCPMCRFTMDMASPEVLRKEDTSSFKGDRILVAKFPYHFVEPKRWDIAVFMYPGGAKTNYIKRLVGLPGETILISHGDLWVKAKGQDTFRIARKPPDKLLAMMQPVYDNDYLERDLLAAGWPPRWKPGSPRAAAGWQGSDDGKSFRVQPAGSEQWLVYRHCVPSYKDWLAVLDGNRVGGDIQPQLISDFAAYNSEQTRPKPPPGRRFDNSGDRPPPLGPEPPDALRFGIHWVGDLVLEFTVDAEGASGQVLADLVRGGRHFLCELDLTSGQAALSIRGVKDFRPTGSTKLRGAGRHDVRFANVDDQLLLWVDGRLVEFDRPTTYDSRALDVVRPRKDDLYPAQIGARDAAVRVSHLKLFRDIYYIAQRGTGGNRQVMTDYAPEDVAELQRPSPEAFLSDPGRWDAFRRLQEEQFELAADQFFMLGDNSAQSKDSRLWDTDPPYQHYVHRDLLKGKAVFIYWPHSWDRTPGFPGVPRGVWFPLFPNVARMGFVR